MIASKNFICSSFFNLKVDIIFLTYILNILLDKNFDLHRSK